MINKEDKRNERIIQRRKTGASYKVIASEFRLSPSRIQQIVLQSKKKNEEQAQLAKLLREIRMTDDIDKTWPSDTLINGLQFSIRAKKGLTAYFCSLITDEISLRDIMDFMITNYVEIPNDLYEACPAYKQCHVGQKTYISIIEKLSTQDLGKSFRSEWDKRLRKMFRFMLKRWGHIPNSYSQYERQG